MSENINFDAWSSGQMGSKLWLCEKLEERFSAQPAQTVWVLGGWYGMLSFLLLSRDRLNIERIRSFDLEPSNETIADKINENWIWRDWKFKAKTCDCNKLDFKNSDFTASKQPSIVICTSVEHFESKLWWENIPTGTYVVLQSTDMKHKEHTVRIDSCEDLLERCPLATVDFKEKLFFDYGSSKFHRFMLMGRK